MNLPQFKPETCCSEGKAPNACCKACRSVGPEWDAWRLAHAGAEQFPCPYPSAINRKDAKPTLRDRAEVSWASAKAFFAVIATRSYVDAETIAARRVSCLKCDLLGTDERGTYCAAKTGCGCGVGNAPKYFGVRIEGADLTIWEEVGNDLCRHPHRSQGKGWPINSTN